MSEGPIGESYVRIRPLLDTFAGEAQAQVDKSLAQVKAKAQSEFQDVQKQIEDLQLRATAAGFRAATTGSKSEQFKSEILSLQATALQMQSSADAARSLAAEKIGAEKEALLAAADAFVLARNKVQSAITQGQQTGKIPELVPSGGGPGGITGFLGAGSAGRTGGLAGLVGSGLRLGAIGFAATAAFQALGEVQQMLKVTGDEAFTVEGRFRNLGAELLSGNFIGAIKALSADRPADLVGDLKAKVDDLKKSTDFYTVTEEKLLALRSQSVDKSNEYIETLKTMGAISGSTADALKEVTDDLYEQANAARVAATAVGDVADEIARAGSEAAAFGERSVDEFGRGPGAIAAQAAAAAATGGTFTAGTGGTSVGDVIRASIASRIRDEKARLTAELEAARLTEQHARALFENVKGTKAAAAAYHAVVEAHTRTVSLQNQIAGLAEQNAKSAKQAADAAAKDAAAKAAQAAADAKAAREQSLENEIAKAALTKRKSDDRKAFAAAIDYWRTLARTADSAREREEAQAKVLDLRARLQKVLKGDAAGEDTAEQLRVLRLENAIQAAQLTRGLGDDKAAIKKLIAYYREQFANAEGLEKEQIRSKLIAARLRLQGLAQTQGGESPDVFAERIFAKAADQFRRFGSNLSLTPGGLLAPQDARGLLGSLLVGGPQGYQAAAQRTRDAQLSETRKQTTLLQIIARGPVQRITGVPLPKEAGEVVARIGSEVLRGL